MEGVPPSAGRVGYRRGDGAVHCGAGVGVSSDGALGRSAKAAVLGSKRNAGHRVAVGMICCVPSGPKRATEAGGRNGLRSST